MNKALQFRLAFLLSIFAIGTSLPAAGQAVKPWESYGIRLDASPYDIRPRVRVSVTRPVEQTEMAHWQGYWPANLAAQVSSHQPEAEASGDLRVYVTQSGCAAPLVFGHIGGSYDTTFLYFQDLGAVGRLMDFMEVPEPAVVVEGNRFGWRGVTLPRDWKPARAVLVSEGYLFLKHGTLATSAQRAQWYLQCLVAVYEKIAPKPAKVDDWDALAVRTAQWLDNYPNWVKYGPYEFVPAYTNATYGGELQVLVELAEAAYRADKQSKLAVKEPEGVERDAVLGYAYAMMLGYDLFHDAEFLEEAKHALDQGDADEFAMPYQLQIVPMGMVACGRLYKLTGEKKYLDRAQCYLAYFLQQTWFYQAMWGFPRAFQPSLLSIPGREPTTAPPWNSTRRPPDPMRPSTLWKRSARTCPCPVHCLH